MRAERGRRPFHACHHADLAWISHHAARAHMPPLSAGIDSSDKRMGLLVDESAVPKLRQHVLQQLQQQQLEHQMGGLRVEFMQPEETLEPHSAAASEGDDQDDGGAASVSDAPAASAPEATAASASAATAHGPGPSTSPGGPGAAAAPAALPSLEGLQPDTRAGDGFSSVTPVDMSGAHAERMDVSIHACMSECVPRPSLLGRGQI